MNPGENFMRPVVFVYAVCAFLLFWKLTPLYRLRFLRSVGELSLGIYFVHLAVRNLTKEAAASLLYSNWLGGTVGLFLVLAISYGIVYLFSQDADGWIIMGKTPSRKQAAPIADQQPYKPPVDSLTIEK